MKKFSYLALGDSYTIGEQVPLFENFPYQAIQLLRKNYNHSFYAPEIVAKTGWTTDELNAAIDNTVFLPEYDIVSLLIGVNNQYRGRSVENYKEEYGMLLKKAISFAGGNHQKVFVLSIPDWGVTPFAKDRDAGKIAAEIDEYNNACRQITEKEKCTFIDITESQRSDGSNPLFLATDELHPSGNEYAKWAEKLANKIAASLA